MVGYQICKCEDDEQNKNLENIHSAKKVGKKMRKKILG